MQAAVLAVCTAAARDLNIVMTGETLEANDAATILFKLRLLLDNWNAQREAIFNDTFFTGTLVPNLAPHTIGPTGATFTATSRPVTVDFASLILTTGSTPVYVDITVRDATWWAQQSTPDITSSIPTDVFYDPDWPNGSLYFWPVPTVAYDVQLVSRGIIADVTLASTLNMPPGYLDAITLTLTEDISVPFGREVPALTARKAREARARIFRNNKYAPPYQTRDSGMPGADQPSTASYLNPYLPS